MLTYMVGSSLLPHFCPDLFALKLIYPFRANALSPVSVVFSGTADMLMSA